MAQADWHLTPMSLKEACKLGKLYQREVFERYRALGGGARERNTVATWIRTGKIPKSRDMAIIHKVLNDACEAEGHKRPLPDLPFLLPPVDSTGDVENNPRSPNTWVFPVAA